MAIGHSETRKNADRIDVGIAVLDLVQEVRPNFSPETVIAEFCQVLKSYRISKVVGDRYAGSFPSEQFEKRGIRYEPSSLSASEIYREALALFNSRKVRLVRNNRLLSQLASLERRTSRRGDIIDHPAGGHDDLAVACCGVLLEVTGNGQSLSMTALAAGWAQRSDDALLKELPLERQSAAYAYESSQWTDLTFEGRNWSARRR